VLVATLLHFPELEPELELLRSERNVGLTEDQVDALCIRMHVTSDTLALQVLPLVTHSLLMVRGSSSGGSLCH
jgi:hypothetical protein